MLCASSVKKWTRFGLVRLVPVVSKPDFAVLPKRRIQISRLAWMPCAERISAGDAVVEGLWRGQPGKSTSIFLRVALFQNLSNLPSPQVEQILFALDPPPGTILSAQAA